MKIVFTGGATGGHFYPIIAVAEAIRRTVVQNQLLEPQMYFISPKPFDEQALFANGIEYIKSPAGKIRRYSSIRNVTDFGYIVAGTLWSLIHLFRIYPDVVFSKGGYGSVPTVLAARILGIPIVIHESDAKPGRANVLASKYAYRIGVAFDSVADYLPVKARSKIARVGIPIRTTLTMPAPADSKRQLGLDESVQTILILGGSLGSQRINDMVLGALAELVSYTNVLHQTGKDNYIEVTTQASVVLEKNPNKGRYHVFPYLSVDLMREAAEAADLIISRAGATSIAEIALWKRPAILIPIPESVSHDQRTNAYAYAQTGAAVVLEEGNMTPHVLASEIKRILGDPAVAQSMAQKGASFSRLDSAQLIAEELLNIGLSHEHRQEVKAGIHS